MYRKLMSVLLSAALICAASVPMGGRVYAAENENAVQTPLSLAQAITLMQTDSNAAKSAQLNKEADQAVAKGYSETYSNINDALDQIKGTSTVTQDQVSYSLYHMSFNDLVNSNPTLAPMVAYVTSGMNEQIAGTIKAARDAGANNNNLAITQLRRDFAKAHIESNYKADMNQIEYNTVQLYYGVLLARENVNTCTENVKAKSDILKNTQNMRTAGMCSDKEVYSAKADLETAKSELEAAKVTLKDTEMKFNYLLGRDVTAEVVLSDSLKKLPLPAGTEDEYVAQALANRPELAGADLAVKIYKKLLDGVNGYPRSSATYMNAKTAYDSAVYTNSTAPSQIEIDVRTKYANINALSAAVENAQKTYDYAKEGYRLTKLSYEAGMTTLANVQDIQATYHKAGLGLSAAIVAYDLGIYSFNYAVDVGTTRLPL